MSPRSTFTADRVVSKANGDVLVNYKGVGE
jgi:hypothetical protein